ncbi:hypothetical protein F1B92_01120 [Campylobacter sp. FMV-PI01]|uniref:ABC transporter permease n=1 Tax=Campylobacter portucalensis TaxID=2608384 RepID=A0A6L5WFI7_9BACT|nr:hypothetical protein [Campylobacter portucalensis]MSN95808.1 hypothetical protein [Campylobacter portucalensis]
MIKKEFYKFKEIYFVFIGIIACFLLYIAFGLDSFVKQNDAVMLNLSFLYEKGFSFNRLDDFNLIFALVIGILVFSKERINGRLRLSLHFPNSTFKNISYIVFIGLLFVCFAYFLEFVFLNLILSNFYHKEFISIINLSLLQNFYFGTILYILAGGIIINPIKKQVILNLVISLAFLYLYFEILPDIYKSFYHNEFGFFYMSIALIYAICSLVEAFYNYKKGYIK